MKPSIVITGAPASAKTEFFERLKTEEALAGFLFFEELARQILARAPHARQDKAALHREIYDRQIEREKAAGDTPFITDRGTVDAFAFHPEAVDEVGTTISREYQRYSAVIQLGSSAGLGEQFYQQDDVRRENIEEALAIEDSLRAVWQDHPAYQFVPVTPDIEEKYVQFSRLIVNSIR